jgi:hypothetical protein
MQITINYNSFHGIVLVDTDISKLQGLPWPLTKTCVLLVRYINTRMSMIPLHTLRPLLSPTARVITRGEDGYRHATEQFASEAYDSVWVRKNLSPDVVVYCVCEADVIATVRTATSTNPPVHLSAHSGGIADTRHGLEQPVVASSTCQDLGISGNWTRRCKRNRSNNYMCRVYRERPL